MPGILTYMLSDVNSPESVASFHFCRLEERFQRVVHLAPGRQAFRLGEKKKQRTEYRATPSSAGPSGGDPITANVASFENQKRPRQALAGERERRAAGSESFVSRGRRLVPRGALT